jgi:hypothetical protein
LKLSNDQAGMACGIGREMRIHRCHIIAHLAKGRKQPLVTTLTKEYNWDKEILSLLLKRV